MSEPIDAGTDIGHVHLKVADIDRALAFYCDVLGFELQQRMGDQAAFISAGGYHHHIGLNTWESRGGSPPPAGTTGLYHFAIRYPTRRALADAVRRLLDAGIRTRYLHSEVDTLKRIELLRDLRLGDYDVLVGINLLREGLDLHIRETVIRMVLQTDGREHGERVAAAIRGNGFQVHLEDSALGGGRPAATA